MKNLFFRCCFCLVTISILLSITACVPSVYVVTGIENYTPVDSPYGTVKYFLPLPDEPYEFLKAYSYTRGDYDYYELSDSGTYETAVLYMEYDEEIYEEAKSYAFQNLKLIEESISEYKQYTFMQNQRCPLEEQRIFFGYCDEKRILIFVGTYMSGPHEYQCSTLAEYLETYFPFYNWEDGKIERPDEGKTDDMNARETMG